MTFRLRTASVEGVLGSGSERLRAGIWRGDERTAYLAPFPGASPPSVPFVSRCLGELSDKGFLSVVTAALAPSESHAFVALDFEEHEHLRLLTHDLDHLPPLTSRPGLRRVHGRDRTEVLAVDAASFPPFWQLDEVGLRQAVAATPTARLRMITPNDSGTVAGYAITGRAGRDGYVQRLAVRPPDQGRGLGRHLALDGLHWLRRRRVRRAIVNTQTGNRGALSFYRHLGFRFAPSDLVVFRRDLT
ncbi:MAG: GNAT family N-acetyltransferase [Actinomycetota bacterium]|nr:GNAT family N-acetyltransferase [Actinomycetota bacterium]